MNGRKTALLRSPAVALSLLLIGLFAGAVSAQDVSSELDLAIGQYWDGLFHKAVSGLEELTVTLTGEERVTAYEYLARSHVRLDEMEKGKDVFKELLRLAPEWRPDPGLVAGPEMSVFERALEEYENEHLGGVNVRTAPTRANVYLDGDLQKEPTPLTVERVPAGDHALRVEMDGFVAVDTVFAVVAGEIALFDLALEPAPEEKAPVPFWKKRWVQLTGGVVGLGLILAVTGGGGGGGDDVVDDGDLPFFPDPPHE